MEVNYYYRVIFEVFLTSYAVILLVVALIVLNLVRNNKENTITYK